MYKAVIDASALLAFLKDEKIPLNELESLLPKSVISTVNAAEVATVLTRLGMPQEKIENSIEETIGQIIPFTKEHCLQTAALWEQTKQYGLSLGDRACLALAMHLNLPVYTADKIWAELQIDNITINLIR